MEITAFILFYTLAREIPVRVAACAKDCIISQVRLYHGVFDAANTLYLVREDQLPLAKLPADSAVLICRTDALPDLTALDGACAAGCIIASAVQLMELCTNTVLGLQTWHSKVLLSHLAAQPLVEALPLIAQLLPHPYCLIDRNFHTLYVAENWPEEGKAILSADTVGATINDPEFLERVHSAEVFCYRFPGVSGQYLCCGVRSGEAMLITPDWDVDLPEVRNGLMLTAADLVEQLLPHYRAAELLQHQSDAMHNMFRSMLFHPDHYTTTDAERILQDYGWTVHQEYTVVVVGFPRGSGWQESAAFLCMQLERLAQGSCAIEGTSGLVWIFNRVVNNTSLNRQEFTDIISTAADMLHCRAGVSYSFSGFWNIRVCYQQASAALYLGHKSNPEKNVFFFRDHTLDFIFHRLTSGFFLPYMYHPAVFSMINYDTHYGTDYFHTLHCYADCAGSVSLAAEKLFIHRTTLIRRLERISQLSQRDITSPDDLFLLQFSFHVIDRIHKGCTSEELMREIERTYYKMSTESTDQFWLEL